MSSKTELSNKQLKELSLSVVENLNTQPEAYTVDSAAKAIGVSRRTIEAAIYDQSLRAQKVGRRWVIRRDALLRWLA